MAPLAWHGLGQAQEASGKFAEAATSYERAIGLAGPAFSSDYRLDRARALAAAGQKEAALKIYRQVLSAPPSEDALANRPGLPGGPGGGARPNPEDAGSAPGPSLMLGTDTIY